MLPSSQLRDPSIDPTPPITRLSQPAYIAGGDGLDGHGARLTGPGARVVRSSCRL
jgi:hypothetical protein